MLGFLVLMLRVLIDSFRSRHDLVLENLVLRHQLDVLQRTRPKPRLRNRDRVLWVWLRRPWPRGWARQLRIVRPDTVIGWHRQGWRLYWTWRSRTRLGRPRLGPEVRELIARMSRENRLWGTEHIRGELLKLAIVVSNRSIRRYRWRGHRRERSQNWRTFLRNQIKGIWAADLFVVQTIGFQTLYVFLFISHERRELIHFNVAASPTAAWIWRQAIEATAWGRQPRYLIHDRDKVYGDGFGNKLAGAGIAEIRTPYRAPLANSVAERVVGTFRQEYLDHVVVFNERHLLALLTEFVHYYNHDRPHRTIQLKTPVPSPPIERGAVVSRPILGGLHHAT
ncbi:MAG TPA: integrase core domain-containing protein [Candidatus Micrarchaeaceae archaeon]|nr:integrase core domain-containing protein [Candidatus Micrarchaeaceae archaeon]